jgi:hypothetical protein
VVQA